MKRIFKVLGIIPARGGSKGVPRKNIRLVAGKPLISYSIQAAQESRSLTDFLVTTDDAGIAKIARRQGSLVLMRPKRLAQDSTAMVPVLLHALFYAENAFHKKYDAIAVLQPTSPIRKGKDIDSAIKQLSEDKKIDSLFSVCRMTDMHPARMYKLNKKGFLNPLCPEYETVQRQKLPAVYFRNGAIYLVRRSVLVRQHAIMGKRRKAYLMPAQYLVNINDKNDLLTAGVLVKLWKKGEL